MVDLIVKLGAGAIDKLPAGIKKDPEAVAATITNNMRKVIIDEHALNPKYYDKMSELLDAIIEQRRQQAIDYQENLAKLLEAAKKLGTGEGTGHDYPEWVTDGARKALVDFAWPNVEMARAFDHAIRTSKPDAWVGSPLKEKVVLRALKKAAPDDFDDQQLYELFNLVKARDEYR